MLVFQIQNADDVLITPLEKFRKEQIGAAKVRAPHHTWPHSGTQAQTSPWVSVRPSMSKKYLSRGEWVQCLWTAVPPTCKRGRYFKFGVGQNFFKSCIVTVWWSGRVLWQKKSNERCVFKKISHVFKKKERTRVGSNVLGLICQNSNDCFQRLWY